VTNAVTGTAINNAGTINLTGSGTISGVTTITNTGTIKTSNATELANLLPKLTSGTIVASGTLALTDDATVPGGVTLTLAESTTLTVPNGKTLTLGEVTTGAEHAATLVLTDNTSQLVLEEGGKVNAANAGSTISGIATTGGVTVTGTNANMSVTAASTDWTIALIEGEEVLTGSPITLGKLKITVATSGVITHEQLTDNNDSGTLTAGEGTTIAFAGEEDVG
jgi:hypothetical protein